VGGFHLDIAVRGPGDVEMRKDWWKRLVTVPSETGEDNISLLNPHIPPPDFVSLLALYAGHLEIREVNRMYLDNSKYFGDVVETLIPMTGI